MDSAGHQKSKSQITRRTDLIIDKYIQDQCDHCEDERHEKCHSSELLNPRYMDLCRSFLIVIVLPHFEYGCISIDLI